MKRGKENSLVEIVDSINRDISYIVENVSDTDIAIAKQSGKRLSGIDTGIDLKFNIIKWTLFFPIALINKLIRVKAKKRRIKKILSREKDLERREKLKKDLEKLTQREVRIVANMSYAKEKAKKKADKNKEKIDRKEAAKSTRQMKKAMKKLERVKSE